MVSNSKKEKGSKQYKHRSDHDRVEKVRDREHRSPSDDDKSRSPTPTKSHSNDPSNATRDGNERMSLSVDETNKLRASLGLKPLAVDDNANEDSDGPKKGLNSDENFVHRPAANLTEKKRTEQVMEKISVHREKRQLQEKFLTTPILAAESAESATSWVDKMRKMGEEKRKAAERAKSLQQMDEEFGVSNIINEESERQKQRKYTSKNLAGLRIEHSIDEFKEGQQVILTLKDKKIISDRKPGEVEEDEDDNDDDDVLINVNIADNELAKQRAELAKKKTPGYRAYDDSESADQFGMFNPNKLLDQYDEKKKSSFRLESNGAYDMSDERVVNEMKQEIRARMQTLSLPTPKIASEFYTPDEMERFKKPKKVTKKKLRSRKMLKADDLLAMDSSEPRRTSSTSVTLRPAENRRSTAIVSTSKERPVTVSLDKIKRELITTAASDDEDMMGPNDDISNFAIEDDAYDELQTVINKTMKLKTKKDSISTEKALSELIEERDRKLKIEIKSEPMETGIILPPGSIPSLAPIPPDDKNLVLDTMSEFCRNVGENAIDSTATVPKLRAAAKLKRANVQTTKKASTKNNAALDPDDELLQHALENEDLDDDAMDDTPADDVNTKPFRLEESILASEPTLDRGLSSALKLAVQKGYIEQEKHRQNARFISDISAKNYTVEEKNSYEIDDKHARRDRYTSGPLTDFKEKEHYRPEVKLEYVDETGRRMNEKEAFRFLSHRFHGKGSGKNKTEKRAKKLVEEETMRKMSSVDTPLQTCNLLKQKQIELRKPYIVLNVMSQSVIVPPVHDTSPPPFDDDADDNDVNSTMPNNEFSSLDGFNNSNDDWKSMDDNDEIEITEDRNDQPTIDNTQTKLTPIQHDELIVNREIKITENQNDQPTIDNTRDTNAQIQHDEPIANYETEITTIQDDQPVVYSDIENFESQDDKPIVNNEDTLLTNINIPDEEYFEEANTDDNGWANFATFENATDEVLETSPMTTPTNIEQNDDDDGWADFESNTIPVSESQTQLSNDVPIVEVTETKVEDAAANDEDDDFGEFSEVQVAPKPQISSISHNTLSTEQIDSLISTCFPVESSISSTNDDSVIYTELPSFTSYKNPTKRISCLEASLALWDALSTITNDPIGIKYQWRKSHTERLFHQSLGVSERLRTKAVPLTPEILQPEKVKPIASTNSTPENIDNENKLSSENVRPRFDWKRSGLENPLADDDFSSNISNDENSVFDANKTLDLDFYVPTTKSSNEDEHITSLSSLPRNDTPIIQSTQQQSHSIPIKTSDLFPGSTTTLTDDAKRIIDNLPNLSFMSAKALMFPIRFNSNTNDESATLY
ncbi:unnamed protein product [Rotaria socialis]|uniref:U4/U6.U5 tri-snRNP-associated protein 1 n=1 Tax=Rotaria socialis TaxID=392032 RepID=A0A818A6V8_9BILA|nr:unnamed protein product [Rotaria socialis]CAF3402135.1 unnamed protein product [Rotaria socialis]